MQLLLNDISSEVRQGLAHLSGHLILGIPVLIFLAGTIATAHIAPDAPFDMEKVDLVFMEKSPEFRSFLLSSLPRYIPVFSLFFICCFVHMYVVLPWLLRTAQTKTSQSLRIARSLLIHECSDTLRRIIEEPSFRLRIERSVRTLQQSEDARSYSSPLYTALATFILTWMIVGPTDGSLQFHEVAAQLIPVLMIALMLNTGAVRDQKLTWSERFIAILAFLTLVGGETVALCALLNGQPQYADITLAAIAAGFTGVAEAAFTRRSSADA